MDFKVGDSYIWNSTGAEGVIEYVDDAHIEIQWPWVSSPVRFPRYAIENWIREGEARMSDTYKMRQILKSYED